MVLEPDVLASIRRDLGVYFALSNSQVEKFGSRQFPVFRLIRLLGTVDMEEKPSGGNSSPIVSQSGTKWSNGDSQTRLSDF